MLDFTHKQYPSYYQMMLTLFQTIIFNFFKSSNIFFKKITNPIITKHMPNINIFDFEEWLPIKPYLIEKFKSPNHEF